MRLYDILKDFPGSQDGSTTDLFVAGTQRELSDWLADCVVPQGWAKPAGSRVEPVAENVKIAKVKHGK